MTVSLRGLGSMTTKDCRTSSACTAYENLVCNTAGYFTDYCTSWRAGLDSPPSVQPPQIDTTPGSPTYGQAMVDGHAVASAADANAMLDQQSMAQIAAWQAQNQAAFDSMSTFTTVPGIADWTNPLDALNPANWSPNTILLIGVGLAALAVFWSNR